MFKQLRDMTLLSVTKEESRRSLKEQLNAELAHLTGLPFPARASESVTYTMEGPHPNRAVYVAVDGTKLGEIGDRDGTTIARFTKVKATDDNTGAVVAYFTFEAYSFSDGWQWADPKNPFHIALINKDQGVLLDFPIPPTDIRVLCGDKGRRVFTRQTITPDVYDTDVGCEFWFPGGTIWQKC